MSALETVRGFWTRRVSGPVLSLLRQGLTPEGIALSLAVGLAAGIFPVIGATTLLGFAIGVMLRLNQPTLQLANWLAYPLQLVLILPLVRLGERVAGVAPVSLDVRQVVAHVTADPLGALSTYGIAGLHGILGWAMVVPLAVLAFYHLLLPALRATSRRLTREATFPMPRQPP